MFLVSWEHDDFRRLECVGLAGKTTSAPTDRDTEERIISRSRPRAAPVAGLVRNRLVF